MPDAVRYIPIATTILTIFFAPVVLKRWRSKRPAPHLFWWSLGIMAYGLGTFTEAFTTLFGWNEWVFRSWYIAGALLGGAPLAQGTVYLMFSRKTATRMAMGVALAILLGSTLAILSPIDYSMVEPHRLTGHVLVWTSARALVTPFVNAYAAIFLIGGAIVSAWRYRKDPSVRHRFIGNCFIAVGALLPGIGGTATVFGHTEVLYVMEFLGIILIWIGYRYNVMPGGRQAPRVEEATAVAG
jgi:hypothetical protein